MRRIVYCFCIVEDPTTAVDRRLGYTTLYSGRKIPPGKSIADFCSINPMAAPRMLVHTRFQLKELLASRATELNATAAATIVLEGRLAEEEEEKRSAHTSVMRLEAQV